MSPHRSRSRRVAIVSAALAGVFVASSCAPTAEEGLVTTARIVPDSTAFALRPVVSTTTTIAVLDPDDPDVDRSDLPGTDYVVQEGDYGLKVAGENGITLDDLVAYNGWDSIASFPWPGEIVRIPPVDPNAPTVPPVTFAPELCESQTHTIAAGEFPLGIADEYEITVEELNQANLGNRAFTTFAIGGNIVIPPNC
ncbi:MAG: LysM peptidoglycan-binding domain-containing protein [Actinomycetota bacterium]